MDFTLDLPAGFFAAAAADGFLAAAFAAALGAAFAGLLATALRPPLVSAGDMNNSPSFESLKSATTNALQEILRQAEVHLQSQLSAAIAADQRSYAFTAVSLASVVLLAGGTYTLENTKPSLAALSALLAAVLFIAAWMASQAARSVQFHFAGSEPRAWCADIADGKQWEHSLAEQCKNYDKVIQSNRDTMERNGRLFNYAVNLALGGTGFLGLVFFGMLYWD